MPIGSYYCETGMLLHNEDGLFLRRDDGGRWQLDVPASAELFVGKHVRVEGTRVELGRLLVSKIEAC